MARRRRNRLPITRCGLKIHEFQAEAGLDDTQLCHLASIHRVTLWRWKFDPLRQPQMGELIRVSKALADGMPGRIHARDILAMLLDDDSDGPDEPTDRYYVTQPPLWQTHCLSIMRPIIAQLAACGQILRFCSVYPR